MDARAPSGEPRVTEQESSRRRWVTGLLQGSAAILALASCGTTKFFSASGKKRPADKDEPENEDAGIERAEETIVEAAALCTISKPEEIPNADATSIPEFRLYGTRSSAMLALLFPAGANVKEIRLMRGDGTPINFRRINPADRIDAEFRPIVIDNIKLGEHENWQVMITDDQGKISKSVQPVSFFNEYEGRPVIDLGARTVPPGFVGNQSVAHVGTGPLTGFDSDATVTYPDANGGPGARSLLTALSGATWTTGAGVLGITTDVMGRTVVLNNSNGIRNYPLFCTYQLSGDSYVRTMLRLG